MISPMNERPSGLDVRSAAAEDAASVVAEAPFDVSAQPQIPEGHYVIAYGPKTIAAI